MLSSSVSPRSAQRLRLLQAYRGRGHRNNNLFLVYSIKTDRDWILPSDRQFIHWIHFLETNKEVRAFDLCPEKVISHDGKEFRGSELDAEVQRKDGRLEWHEVKSDDASKNVSKLQLIAQASAAARNPIVYKLFSDEQLTPHIKSSIYWCKVIAFATAIRDKAYNYETSTLLDLLQKLQQGTIGDVLSEAKDEINDVGVLLGLIARLAITGPMSIDLSQSGFGYATEWRWNDHG